MKRVVTSKSSLRNSNMTRQRILEDDVQAIESYISRVVSADSIKDLERALRADREDLKRFHRR